MPGWDFLLFLNLVWLPLDDCTPGIEEPYPIHLCISHSLQILGLVGVHCMLAYVVSISYLELGPMAKLPFWDRQMSCPAAIDLPSHPPSLPLMLLPPSLPPSLSPFLPSSLPSFPLPHLCKGVAFFFFLDSDLTWGRWFSLIIMTKNMSYVSNYSTLFWLYVSRKG